MSLPRPLRACLADLRRRLSVAVLAIVLAACGGPSTDDASTAAPDVRRENLLRIPRAASEYVPAVQLLYVGLFGRPAEPAAIARWTPALASSGAAPDALSLGALYPLNAVVRAVTDAIGGGDEAKTLLGGDPSAAVASIYRNLLGRAPTASELAARLQTLTREPSTLAQAVLAVGATAAGADARVLASRLEVAARFTAGLSTDAKRLAYSGDGVYAHARIMLGRVGADADAAVEAAALVDDLDYPLVGPGELRAAVPLATIRAADVAAAIAAAGVAVPFAPAYDVVAVRIEYLTSDADGQPIVASGLVAVPAKPAGRRSPVLGWSHGTIFHDAEAPTNHVTPDELGVAFASLGFVVLAPDFVGYGASKGAAHPYLLADPTAAAGVDFLSAARTWRRRNGVADNGQLFLSGYSEGGYAAMAAHRRLTSSGSPHLRQLLAAITGSGPYDVMSTCDGVLDRVRDEQPLLAALITPGLRRFLGASVRERVRDTMLKYLLPGDADVRIDTRFIDRYLADDEDLIAQQHDVHEWKPERPVRLFHGRADQTVAYKVSVSTLEAMRDRGVGNLVTLTDCTAQSAGHLECVPQYLGFLLTQLAGLARDL